jgi:fructose-bisphosphate aldolase, class I
MDLVLPSNIDKEYPGNPYPFMEARIASEPGFIAALDQSGGSSPVALSRYMGKDMSHLASQPEKMFHAMHALRQKIMASPAFNHQRILGTILFEDSLTRRVNGLPTAYYLWREKHIVPFLKIDKGLEELSQGVQLMKAMPTLEETLKLCVKHAVFGTKMRAVIHEYNPQGIDAILAQQFDVAEEIFAFGLTPILEPEVNIKSERKALIEDYMLPKIETKLDQLGDRKVILKLSLPSENNLYETLINHPNVMRVVALSGGHDSSTANQLLRMNPYLIASFSRVLFEGLGAHQARHQFEHTLNSNIEAIYRASTHGMTNHD